MKLVGRIAVEPLSEERLTRIERRVVAGAADAAGRGLGARATRPTFGRMLAAVAVVAAGVAGWLLHGAPGRGPVVAAPAPIRVEADVSRTHLDIGDAKIEGDPGAGFAVMRPDGGVLVEMTRGKIELEVGKRGMRPPLIVRAGATDVIVIGTHFAVDYGDGQGDVAVQVTEGVVRVVHEQHETRVAAGQAWQTRKGLVASADLDGAAEVHPKAPGDAADGSVAAQGSPNAAVTAVAETPIRRAKPEALGQRSEGSAESHVRGQPPDVLHDRKAAVPDAPVGPVALLPRNPAAKPASGDAVRPHERAKPAKPEGDLRTLIRAQPVEAALDLGEPNPASAVAKYYDIAAHKSGEEASQAFYSIAVVQHLKLARHAEALQTLDAYLRRFPGGKEYRAALWLRVRILCLDKIDDRCRAAAYTYLHEDPPGPAAHVAESITLSE